MEVRAAVAQYARRLHTAVGDRHHVASPLGAWLLLALCGSAGGDRELSEALGMDPRAAATAAAALVDHPHPLVRSATAVWHRPDSATEELRAWSGTLPSATDVGPMPDQATANAWVRDNSLGLIESIPLQMADAVALAMASVLATRVSWRVPFEVAPAAALGPAGAWAGRLQRVLRSPSHRALRGSRGSHAGFIAATPHAGDVVVHVAEARSDGPGLAVVSVAAAPGIPPADVLAAAYELAPAALDGDVPGRRSLFDLPLGETPLWTIEEESTATSAPDGREERHRAVVPCWSADSKHDLGADALGFPAAARALAPLLRATTLDVKAAQTAVARYGRYGFEAAAVTAFGVALSAPPQGVVRTAELRFGHPYAVVAVATGGGPWDGIPVFSAWISEPEDLPAADAD